MIRNIALVALVLAAITLPFAAEAQRQGGQRQGGGQGRGNMMMGAGAMRGLIIGRKDVQADLKVTPEQRAAIEKMQTEARERMQTRMQEIRNGGGQNMDFNAMRAEFEKLQADTDAKINEILDDAQEARLKQLELHFAGPSAIFRDEVQKDLALRASQKRDLDDLNTKLQEANRAIGQRARDGEISQEQARALREQNNKAMEGEINKVLTPEQQAKWKEMLGAPFKRDPQEDQNMMRGFGGRPGGGGGGLR